MEVHVLYGFDTWAFGCIVFDVLQQHPRLRSVEDKVMRLFSCVNMKLDCAQVLSVRNYRLTQKMAGNDIALVLRCQPDRVLTQATDRAMGADLLLMLSAL